MFRESWHLCYVDKQSSVTRVNVCRYSITVDKINGVIIIVNVCLCKNQRLIIMTEVFV